MRLASCDTCRSKKRTCDHKVETGVGAAPAIRFEPMGADVVEPFTGRPYTDPRNNFTLPKPQAGNPKRDMLASPIRTCVFDIEATGLDASFGRVLCAVAQFWGPDETKIWRADNYPGWAEGKRCSDRALVEDILKGLDDADIVIAYNGTMYDMPFLRTRAAIQGLPPVHPKKIFDPVWTARRQFRFHSNSMDSVSMMLGTKNQKTPLNPWTWVRAMGDGDKAAMDEIVEHCHADVLVLAETARKLAPYIKSIDVMGSSRQ